MQISAIITLPPGCTWETPPAELYRHIYPQCAGLADLIGSIQDSQQYAEELENDISDRERHLEHKNAELQDALDNAVAALNALLDCPALNEDEEEPETTAAKLAAEKAIAEAETL